MDIQEVRNALLALLGIDGVTMTLHMDVHCTNPTTDLPDETWYQLGRIRTGLEMQGCVLVPLALIGEQLGRVRTAGSMTDQLLEASMSKDRLTLRLEGNVSLEAFAKAMSALSDLLSEIEKEITGKDESEIEWRVIELCLENDEGDDD